MAEITNLRSYHLPEGEVIEPVVPTKPPNIRMVAMSQSDAEILGTVGEGLCKLGASGAGLALIGLCAAWKIGMDA